MPGPISRRNERTTNPRADVIHMSIPINVRRDCTRVFTYHDTRNLLEKGTEDADLDDARGFSAEKSMRMIRKEQPP